MFGFLGLQIPVKIQTIHNPTSFWPFETQTYPDFRSPLYRMGMVAVTPKISRFKYLLNTFQSCQKAYQDRTCIQRVRLRRPWISSLTAKPSWASTPLPRLTSFKKSVSTRQSKKMWKMFQPTLTFSTLNKLNEKMLVVVVDDTKFWNYKFVKCDL